MTKAQIIRARARARGRLRPDPQLLRPRRRRAGLRALRLVPASPARVCGRRRGRPDRLCHRRAGAGMSYAVKEIFYTLQGEGAQHRAPRRLLPVRRLQPVDGPRAGPRDRAICSSATPTSSAPTAPAAAGSRPRPSLAADGRRPLAHRRNGRSPALRRLHRRRAAAADSIAPLIAALHDRGLRGRGRDQRHPRSLPPGSTGSASARRPGRETVLLRGDELKLVYPQDGRPAGTVRDADFDSLLPAADGRPGGRARTPSWPSPTAWRTRSGG